MKIIRGDYKQFKFKRQTKTGEIITVKPENMYFTVKSNYYEDNYLLQKKLDDGIIYNEEDNYYYVEIKPEDTNNLDYGEYVYDIEVKNGNKPNTIKIDTFVIEKEVTFASNE